MANRFSKEIHDELVRMGELYGFERGILLLDENVENQTRAIVFDMTKDEEGAICRFARLIQRCLSVSKTFLDIVNHFNMHSVRELAEEASKDQLLIEHNKKDDKIIN